MNPESSSFYHHAIARALILFSFICATPYTQANAQERPVLPLVQNGWITHDNQVVWGWIQHNGWWRPGQRPNLARRSVGDPEGDVRPNRTEDLDKLTDNMLRYGYPGFEHNYGLWYDRRRDAHDAEPRADANVVPPFLEQPWGRSNTGKAADGLPLYDLTTFNEWYFERLRDFAALCDEKGTVLFHKFHMQHALLEIPAHYVDFPWRPGNCIQDTGMPGDIPAANVFYDVSNPVRRESHRLYIRKCLEVLGAYRNVVHLPAQEFTGPLSYVQFWMDVIMEWEQETGRDINIGLGATKDVVDAILADTVRGAAVDVLDSRSWWLRADGSLNAAPGGREVPGREIESGSGQANETTPECLYRKIREYRDKYPAKAIIDACDGGLEMQWAFFMAGGSLLVRGQVSYPDKADPAEYVKPADVDLILPSRDFIRKHLASGHLLIDMRPLNCVLKNSDSVWCLAKKGEAYLVYTLKGGEINLDLSGVKEPLTGIWFNPGDGEEKEPIMVNPSPDTAVKAPSQEPWVLLLQV